MFYFFFSSLHGMWDLHFRLGVEPMPLQWKHGFLPTGLLGKSLSSSLLRNKAAALASVRWLSSRSILEARETEEDKMPLWASLFNTYSRCPVLSRLVCPTLCNPWTVAHQAPLSMGILQARILEWMAMPSSRGSSQPRDQTQSLALQADSLPSELLGKPRD